jgi:hypothetical protein
VALATLPSLYEPSCVQGFANHGALSAYSGLWQGLIGAVVPALGPSGGLLFDVSGHGGGSVLTNMDAATDWVYTENGCVLDFDGSNDYVPLWSNLYNMGVRRHATISALVNLRGSGLRTVCGDYYSAAGGFSIRFDSSGQVTFYVYPNNHRIQSSASYGLGWHHVVGVMDGENMYLYVDGAPAGNAALGEDIGDIPIPVTIGAAIGGSSLFFNGQLSSLLLHNRALSFSEVTHLYADSLAPFRLRFPYLAKTPVVVGGHAGPLVNGPILKSKFRGLVGSLVA